MPLPTTLLSASNVDLDLRLVSGSWPDDISGEFVVSSPTPDAQLGYALFGAGAISRLSLRPGTHGAPTDRFAWRTRVIGSPSQRIFSELQGFFTPAPFGYLSPIGIPNQSNTAPLPWGQRLFTTWDVGRPVEVDPDTLGFIAEVGHRSSWGDSTFPVGEVLPMYFSSAHPVIDPRRNCLWTVKLTPSVNGGLNFNVIRWDGRSTTVEMWPVAGGEIFGSAHTIAQTDRYLLLVDSGNFKSDFGELMGGERTVHIDETSPVYIIDKSVFDSTAPGTAVTPVVSQVSPSTGHFYAKFDDTHGIEVIFEHMDLMDLGFSLRAGDTDATGAPIASHLVGGYNMAMGPNTISEVVFDPATGASTQRASVQQDWSYNLQLSAIDWSTEGMTRPTLHHVVYQGWKPEAVSQRALEMYRGLGRIHDLPTEETPEMLVTFRRDGLEVEGRYEFGPDDHITSPSFAPRNAGEAGDPYGNANPGGHDGYVVLPVLSDSGFRVEIFDAARVADGPVATLGAPHGETLPVMLHSAWMPSAPAGPWPEVERLRFADELSEQALSGLAPETSQRILAIAQQM